MSDSADPLMTTLATNESAKQRILVVDDEPNLQRHLQRNLEREGYLVTTASDGQEALDILRQVKFDLLVADTMMPKLNGFELAEAVREDAELSGIPVVFLTYRAGNEDRTEWFECEHWRDGRTVWYLTKPMVPSAIVHVAARALGHRKTKTDHGSIEISNHKPTEEQLS